MCANQVVIAHSGTQRYYIRSFLNDMKYNYREGQLNQDINNSRKNSFLSHNHTAQRMTCNTDSVQNNNTVLYLYLFLCVIHKEYLCLFVIMLWESIKGFNIEIALVRYNIVYSQLTWPAWAGNRNHDRFSEKQEHWVYSQKDYSVSHFILFYLWIIIK